MSAVTADTVVTAEEARPTRQGFVTSIIAALDGTDGWAFQGDPSAVDAWIAADDLHDLDLWVERRRADALIDAVRASGGHHVRAQHDPRRLQHEQWWLPTGGRGAIVDITVGDLRVGPLLLCPEYLVRSVANGAGRRLVGAPAAVDLAVRPLLRGRLVDGGRLAAARAEWAHELEGRRHAVIGHLRVALGRHLATDVVAWLDGAAPSTGLAAQARGVLRRATLAPTNIAATWADRRAIVPSRRPGPLGFRQRGVVVALVGTDGSGKSTLADDLAMRLTDSGYEIDHAYFGMARGNLPGLGLIRRLARGSDHAAVAARPAAGPAAPAGPPSLARRAGAWVYAVDYAWRALTRVGPARRRRRVVIVDRWVTDLRRSPAPGSPAAAVAEWIVGPPDVFVLADAPADVIASRKSERTIDEIIDEQGALRRCLAAYEGRRRGTRRCHAMVADTTVPVEVSTAAIVAAVVSAAHR